jgi:hypothetical protein
MARTRLWTKTFTGALSETAALLPTADSGAEGSSIHALVDGDTGTLKIYYTFGFGTSDAKTVLYQTIALADGVLSAVNFQYKVPYYHVTFTGAGTATAWIDVTTF